jgi:hypothetical protein
MGKRDSEPRPLPAWRSGQARLDAVRDPGARELIAARHRVHTPALRSAMTAGALGD